MHDDPYTTMAKEHGCCSCGQRTDRFYSLEYYILPSRLVRKRHRDKGRIAIYCQRCFEYQEHIAVRIGNDSVSMPSGYRIPSPVPADLKCMACHQTMPREGLYGVLAVTLHMSGSMIENRPLAKMCSVCAESKDISLPGPLQQPPLWIQRARACQGT